MSTTVATSIVKVISAVLLILGGALLTLISLSGAVDPVSFQQANDLDPFGPPQSRSVFVLSCLIGLALSFAGGLFLRRTLARR